MRATYDADVDCGYIFLFEDIEPGGVHHSVEAKIATHRIFGSLIIDVDHDGHVIGIEVLGVSNIMPQLKTLAGRSCARNSTGRVAAL